MGPIYLAGGRVTQIPLDETLVLTEHSHLLYLVHVLIVSEDTFFRARHQLEINYKMHPRNRKNNYLLAGMIRCTCGRSRAGEGPKQGTHLYYRCSDRVSSYPLPRTCHRNGLNARIADQLVWDKLTGLMSSQSLITKEIERWSKEEDGPRDVVDIKAVQKELSKSKKEEDRYNRAYAEGIFSLEKLKEYLEPVRANIAKLEASLRETERKPQRRDEFLSVLSERVNVALEAPLVLAENLDFATKREIITRTIDQVVGDQEKIKVTGHIPLQTNVEDYSTNNKGVLSLIFTNVELCTNDWNGAGTISNFPTLETSQNCSKTTTLIPFNFKINLEEFYCGQQIIRKAKTRV